MKRFVLAAAIAGTMLVPAQAQMLNLSKMKCSDFLKSGDQNIGAIVIWLHGMNYEADGDLIFDVDSLKGPGEKLGKYCAANPDDNVASAAEKAFE